MRIVRSCLAAGLLASRLLPACWPALLARLLASTLLQGFQNVRNRRYRVFVSNAGKCYSGACVGDRLLSCGVVLSWLYSNPFKRRVCKWSILPLSSLVGGNATPKPEA